ncbi:MAG: murein biosynthesis integral membrane protein MurJ [Saccharofermentanales bacterium]
MNDLTKINSDDRKKSNNNIVVWIVIISAISRVIGFVREVLLTKYFGSSGETDAYFFSLTIAQFFYIYLVNAINTTFIPVLAESSTNESEKTRKVYNNILNAVIILSVVLFLVALVFVRPLTHLLAGGFASDDPAIFELSVRLSRISIINLLLPGALGILTGFLQFNRSFISSSMIGIPLNAVYLVYLIFLSSRFGIVGLTWASVFATVAQIFFLIPSLKRKHFQYMPILDLRDPYLRKMAKLSVPVILSTILTEASQIVDKSIATWLPTGSVTYLNYGGMVNGTVISVFIYSLIMVVFPAMSKAYASGNPTKANKLLTRSFRLTLLLTIPLSIYLFSYSEPVIKLLFERGRFTHEHTLVTAGVLAMYGIGMPTSAFLLILFKAFHATKDTKSPAISSVLSLLFNIALNILLIRKMGVLGIALASSITSITVTILLIFWFERKHKHKLLNFKHLIYFIKILGMSLACALMIGLLFSFTSRYNFAVSTENIIFIVGSLSALVLYFVLGYLLQIDEIRQTIHRLRAKFARNPRA